MTIKFTRTVLVLIFLFSFNAHAEIRTFTQAKKVLFKQYATNSVTFYCRCPYDKYKKVDIKRCGYQVRKNQKRALRVEAEHIMPAWVFGQSRKCWREKLCKKKNGKQYGGRKCCQKIDPLYRQMENDLNNLVPAIGEVNGDRSNFRFSDMGEEPYQYGSCPMLVDFKGRKAQPPEYTRSKIARAYLYMSKTYNIPLSKQQRQLYEGWFKKYNF